MKQRIPITILSAGLLAAGGALAQGTLTDSQGQATTPAPTASQQQGSDYGNAADKKKVVPSREDVMRDANRPSTSVLDDNAQRQHDPNQAANPSSTDGNAGRIEKDQRAYPHDNGATPLPRNGSDSTQ
jgi:hypothetical protein